MTSDDGSSENENIGKGQDNERARDSTSARETPLNTSSPDSESSNASSSEAISVTDKELLRDLSKPKSSAERSMIKRQREAFLRMVGLDPKEAMTDFKRLCGMSIDPTFAVLGSDPIERARRLEAWVIERRKVMPRACSSALLKEAPGGPVSIDSERAKAVFDDVEELTRLVFLSRTISSRLDAMAADQRSLEAELLDRLAVLKAREDKIEGSIPAWIVELARAVEATGLPAGAFRGVRREMVEAVTEALVRVASKLPEGVNKTVEEGGVFDRVSTRMLDRAEAYGFPFDNAGSAVDGHPAPSASPMDDDDKGISPPPVEAPGPLAPLVDLVALKAHPPTEPVIRAEGHGMIAGLSNVDAAYAGYATNIYGGILTTETFTRHLGDVEMRLDERILIPRHHWVPGANGEIHPFGWSKFEVPAGPYLLLQLKARSSLLPSYSENGMLPPVSSLVEAGALLGINGEPGVEASLSAWCPAGAGPMHERAHVLDGPRGDPLLAYEVCKKLVAMQRAHWQDTGEVSDLALDSMARWWLFLLAGRMRPGQIDLLWPDGFFHGVEGHDPMTGDRTHFRLVRNDGGRIGLALKND